AVEKYDKALKLDADNLLALTEKGITLLSLEKYEMVVSSCKKAIEKHPNEEALDAVYNSYGTALDELKKPKEALKIYSEGIKKFSKNYMLYFNRGIASAGMREFDDAMLDFQKAVQLNPKHAGSHNAIARLMNGSNKKIPALLAYARYLVLDTESKRAKGNAEALQEIMNGNAKKTGDKSVTINLDAADLADTTATGKAKENDFKMANMILSLSAALDFDDKNKGENAAERLARKFESVCAMLGEKSPKKTGFFWTYYAPYFAEMSQKKLVTTFAYIALATTNDSKIDKWLKTHTADIDKFYEWSSHFTWK
ncbi:MAG: hypothetical protein RI894_317, partial [Bacteroidota bacterium]